MLFSDKNVSGGTGLSTRSDMYAQ